MLNRRSLRRVILFSALSSLFWNLMHGQQRPVHEGEKPYIPTRLEWLEVNLNADLRVDLSESTGYSMDFVAISETDTILIYVRYLPSVNRQVMNMSIETARKIISSKGKSHGWARWLNVKEDVEMGRTEPDK